MHAMRGNSNHILYHLYARHIYEKNVIVLEVINDKQGITLYNIMCTFSLFYSLALSLLHCLCSSMIPSLENKLLLEISRTSPSQVFCT